MVNLEALWRKAAALLQQAGIEDAAFDARELCRMCCGADPLCAPQAPVSEAAGGVWRSSVQDAHSTSRCSICWASGTSLILP